MSLDRRLDDIRRRVAVTRPKERQLVPYVRQLFQIPVPDVAVSPGMQTPADHARSIWTGKTAITAAGRDSYKTLVASAVCFLLAHHYGIRILWFGAYDKQAKQAVEYLTTFSGMPWWAPDVRAGTTKFRFRSGGYIECRPLTLANARAAHVEMTVFDEADECRQDARKVAVNITSGRGEHHARTLDMSTKNRPRGPMSAAIKNAPRAGHVVHQWSYKEVAERCPDWRSGTEAVEIFVNPLALIWKDALSRKDDKKQWRRVRVLNGCLKCPLVPTCRADLKRANGAIQISTLIEVFTAAAMTAQEWRSQRENVDPDTEGLVVKSFDPERHVTQDAVYDPKLPCSFAQDFGLSHHAVTLVGQRIPIGHRPLLGDGTRGMPNQITNRVRVLDEYACHQAFEPHVVTWLAVNWFPIYGWPLRFWIDPSGAPAVESVSVQLPNGTRRRLTLEKANNAWDPGVRRMEGLASPQLTGEGLEINPKCRLLIEQLQKVQFSKRPDGTFTTNKDTVTGDDDAHDTFRYLSMGLCHYPPVSRDDLDGALADLEAGGM